MVRNERLKLLANTLNNIALAFAIGGVVAPMIAGRLPGGGASRYAAWVGAGIALHGAAQLVLGRMRA